MADHLVTELDGYADSLRAARASTCARRIAEQDTDCIHERRVACLDARENALAGLLGAVEQVEASQVDNLVSAVAKLPSTAACDDTTRLLAELPPPEPELADAVADQRYALARLRAQIDLGSVTAAEAAAAREAEARELGYAPLIAEATYVHGRALFAAELLDPARATFERAYVAALALGYDEIAVLSAAQLLFVVGVERGDFAAGQRWSDHGLALAERSHEVRARAELLGALATMDRIGGELPTAVAHAREAFEALTLELGPEHLETGRARGNYGVALIASGDPLAGLVELEQASTIYATKLGPNHPKLAALSLNLGAARAGLHTPQQDALAIRDLERALEIHQRTNGSAKDIAFVRGGLAEMAVRQGELGEAQDQREFVVTAFRDYYGEAHVIVADAELELAETLLLTDELERGRELAGRALATLSQLAAGSADERRAQLVVAVLALASGERSQAPAVAEAWRALAADPSFEAVELEMWFDAHPDSDPRELDR